MKTRSARTEAASKAGSWSRSIVASGGTSGDQPSVAPLAIARASIAPSPIAVVRLTGPPSNSTRGSFASSPTAGTTSASGALVGRLTTTPSAPSVGLCSSSRITVRAKVGSVSAGVATSRLPRIDSRSTPSSWLARDALGVARSKNGHESEIVTPVTADTSVGGEVARAVPLKAVPRPAGQRPALRAVPARRRRQRRGWGDAVFATTLAIVLGVGIVGVLLLNTPMQTQADQIQATQQKRAALRLVVQGEQTVLDRLNTPGTLAARASALHMRPATAMPILRVSVRPSTRLPAPAKSHGLSARARAKSPAHGG